MGTDPSDCVHDAELRADQYRHHVTHRWGTGRVSTRLRIWCVQQESVSEEWIPADPAREWVLRNRTTGQRRFLRGSYRSAVVRGLEDSFLDTPPQELRARHGDYYAADEGREPEPGHGRHGTWQSPTPEFFASLPRDPRDLLERLRADSPRHSRPAHRRLLRYPIYVGPWVYALDALRGGLVPADLRAALYRALRMLPAVSLNSQASTLDGARAIALTLDVSPSRHEMLVDPCDGTYIGERHTVIARNPAYPVRPGTTIKDVAVRRQIVNDVRTPGAFA